MGRFARSVESGWLGKVVGVESHGGDTMLRMQGVNVLCWQIAGGSIEDHLDTDDVQWFSPADLRFVTLV